MCPSISAISDRSFRGSVNYCMPMVLNIKEHEQFFKKCVQKMLTTAEAISRRTDGRSFKAKISKTYSQHSICRTGTCKCRDIHLIAERRVDFPEINRGNSTICSLDNDRDKPSPEQW